MKIPIRILVIMAVLLLGVDSTFAGGGSRNGTGGATELTIPVGASGIALAGSDISTTSGLGALFWNPAGVSHMTNSATATFSHMDYIANIGVEYGAVATNFQGFGVISLDIKALSVGSIPITTNEQPDGTGQTYTPQFITAGASYSRELTDRIAIGVTFNYISETIAQVSASGVAFDAGLQYADLGDIKGLSFGLVVKNIGPAMTYGGSGLLVQATATGTTSDPTEAISYVNYYSINAASFNLPSSFEIGFGYQPEIDATNKVQLSADYQNNNYSGDVYNVGGQYGYNNTFFARVGYSYSPKNQDPDYIYGFTAGAGINYNLGSIDLQVDYSYRAVKYFDGNNVFALTLAF
jgi:hypothetical protein